MPRLSVFATEESASLREDDPNKHYSMDWGGGSQDQPSSLGSKSFARRVRAAVLFRLVVALLALSSSAMAKGKVVTISEVTIVGRVQKPIATVDVNRIQPNMTLAELRQPFLDRIEKAIYHAPF